MTREAFVAFCESLPGAAVDKPFAMDALTTVARHEKNKRWFAILMQREGENFVNLKCRPAEAAILRGSFEGIKPGFHMNKNHWISVYLNEVPLDVIKKLTEDSHRLTAPKMRKVKLKIEEN